MMYTYTRHTITHDGPLTGVHWPIHRDWCRGSGTKGDLSTCTGDTHRVAGWRTKAPVHARVLGCVVYSVVRSIISNQIYGPNAT